jgi:hypothetical protein
VILWSESTTERQKSLPVRHLERCLAGEADSVGTVLSRLGLRGHARQRSGAYCDRARKRGSALRRRVPPKISLFTTRAKQGSILRFPTKKTMEKKPAPTEDHSLGRELRVGLAGLGMAAGLITIFLLIMSYLAQIVHQHFGGSLPFFLDRG